MRTTRLPPGVPPLTAACRSTCIGNAKHQRLMQLLGAKLCCCAVVLLCCRRVGRCAGAYAPCYVTAARRCPGRRLPLPRGNDAKTG